MVEIIIPVVVLLIGLFIWEIIRKGQTILSSCLFLIVLIIISSLIIVVDQSAQMTDTEVWSGRVIDWNHKEEWDEWHPPRTITETYTTTVNGQTVTKTRTKIIPGYWQHHYATNKIKTSDDGWITVHESPDNKKMDDKWPNDTETLQKMWPKGTPTASAHTYVNKVQASYSVFKHEDIDLEDFKDLPEYPKTVRDLFYVDRILGEVPNKDKSLLLLNEWNSELNKMITDPENKDKKISWKQVNIIFVNVGENKSQEYGFALQDKWEGGNKNDFVVSFSMNKDGTVNWVHPFSWSEVEILKLEIKDYMMNLKKIEDFSPVVDQVSTMISEKFVRKEFADFSYLHIDVRLGAVILIWILAIGSLVARVLFRNTQF